MRDQRDAQELGTAILALKKARGCSILEAADALDQDGGLNTIVPTTLCALPAKIQPALPAPDVSPQERVDGKSGPGQ